MLWREVSHRILPPPCNAILFALPDTLLFLLCWKCSLKWIYRPLKWDPGISSPTVNVSHSIMSNSLQPHGLQAARLFCPQEFFRQEYWSGLLFPSVEDLTDTRFKFRSPALQADSLHLNQQWSPPPPKSITIWGLNRLSKSHDISSLTLNTVCS